MAGVNGVEIKVGQVWRCRDGQERRVVNNDGHQNWPWDLENGDSVTDNGAEFEDGESRSDLIELVKDENGFTTWRGGKCPVSGDTLVECRLRSGTVITDQAKALYWSYDEESDEGDIVAYKVVEEAAQADSATLAEETLSALGWTFDGQAWVEQPKIELVAPTPTMQEPGYELLAYVLERAYNQAALGKGKERHANGEPFDEQVMQDGARRFGVGALLFQAFKKSEESQRLPLDRGVNELLGAIVYLAGAVIRREADAREGGA